MDNPREPRPMHRRLGTEESRPSQGAEYFEHEFAFMEDLSNLVDVLERYEAPSRTSTQFELLGGVNELRKMPEDISWIPGSEDPSAIHITLVSENHKAVSTTIEIFGSFGVIYISRSTRSKTDDLQDALKSEYLSKCLQTEFINPDNSDVIIGNNGVAQNLPRISNPQINDFLFSLTRRGQAPELSRLASDEEQEELVIGENMVDALSDCAVGTFKTYEYQLDDDRILYFNFSRPMSGSTKLLSVDLFYRDWDMNKLSVHVNMSEGLDIKFKRMDVAAETDNTNVFPTQKDYAIVRRVIREIKNNLLKDPANKRVISIEEVPQSELEKIAAPEND